MVETPKHIENDEITLENSNLISLEKTNPVDWKAKLSSDWK